MNKSIKSSEKSKISHGNWIKYLISSFCLVETLLSTISINGSGLGSEIPKTFDAVCVASDQESA